MHHVPLGTTAKRQIEFVAKSHKIRKRIVFAIVKDTTDIRDFDVRQFLRATGVATDGKDQCQHSNAGNQRPTI